MNLDSPTSSEDEVSVDSDAVSTDAEDVKQPVETSTTEQGDSDAEAPAADDKEPKTALEAAEAALKKANSEGESSAPKTEQSEDDDADPGEDLADEVSKDELDSYKPKTRRRIEKLLGQLGETRDRLSEFEEGHTRFSQMKQFVQGANLTSDEVNTGFDIMAAMKNDPAKAYEMLKPYLESLETVIGERLPEDLQTKVNDGYLDEETAREMARSRSGEALSRQAAERARQEADNIRRSSEVSETVRSTSDAATQWERRLAETDPDYKAKQPRVSKEVRLLLLEAEKAGNIPQTPAAVTALLDEALKTVNAEFARFKPKRTTVTPERGGTAAAATAEPKTLLEAAQIGLRKAKEAAA